MSTENLIVELKAKTQDLEQGLRSAKKDLKGLEGQTDSTDAGLAKMSKTAVNVGNVMMTMGKGVVAAGAALTTFITLAAKSNVEMKQMANTANTTTENFKALAFAFSQVGIDAQGTADAMNDVTEAAAEFYGLGSGPFQDFADVMGLSAEEARALSGELMQMESDAALKTMSKQMEDAGVSGAQMSQTLKAISSDLAYVTPLLADNGAELDRLTQRSSELNKQLALTEGQAKDLQSVSESFDLLTGAMGSSAAMISATLAPAMEGLFNGIIDVVPDATNAIVDFINTFRSAQDIQSTAELDRQMESVTQTISDAQAELAAIQSGERTFLTDLSKDIRTGQLNESLNDAMERMNELQAQYSELESKAEEKVKKGKGGSLSSTGGKSTSAASTNAAELEALEDRFKSEQQLLQEKYDREYEMAVGNKELQKQLEEQFLQDIDELREGHSTEAKQAALDAEYEQLVESYEKKLELAGEDQEKQLEAYAEFLEEKAALDEEYEDSVTKSGKQIADDAEKTGKKTTKGAEQEAKDKQDANDAWVDASIQASAVLFEDNKLAQYANATVNTAQAVTKALPNYPLAAAVAASGALQLATISSTSKSSSGSVSTPSEPPAEAQDDFSIEDSSVEASGTVNTAGGTTTGAATITFNSDDADGLTNAIAESLNAKIKSGEITLG